MDKGTFMETLHATRAEWESLLAEIGEERMLLAGANGEWSVKDLLAHIMWGEREVVGVCQARALVGSDLWQMTDDERNPIMVSWYRDSTLQAVLSEEREVYAQLLAEVEKLSAEDLNDARNFRDMPPAWLPWQVISGCSFKHYRDHMPTLRAWLDGLA
ncbi:MAG TPA: DinB family protein [Ktedonobacteraceae bacterium]